MGKKKDAAKAAQKAEKRRIKSRGYGQFPVIESSPPTGAKVFTAVDPDNTPARSWDRAYGHLPDDLDRQYDAIQNFIDERSPVNYQDPDYDPYDDPLDLSNHVGWDSGPSISHNALLAELTTTHGVSLDHRERDTLRDMVTRYNNDADTFYNESGPRPVDYAAGTVAYFPGGFRPRKRDEEEDLARGHVRQQQAAAEGRLAPGPGEQLTLFEHEPAQITNLATSPALRGRGIGSTLLNHAVQAAYDDPSTNVGPGDFPPIDRKLSTDSAGMAEHLYGQPVEHQQWTEDRNVMDHFFHKLTSMPGGMVPGLAAVAYGTRRQYNEANEPVKETNLKPGRQILNDTVMGVGTARMAHPPATSLERKTMDLHNAEARRNVAANMEMQRMTPLRRQRDEERAGVMRLPGTAQRRYLP